MADFKLRVNYQKLGPLSYLSHLEIVRTMERVIRRSGLDYAVSQGFNVHLRHSFSAALPVATASLDEYMDIDLEEYLPAEQALAKLQAAAVPHLPIVSVQYVGKGAASLQVSHCVASYELELVFDDLDFPDYLLKMLNSTPEIVILKKAKPKKYLLTEYLKQKPSLVLSPGDAHRATLSITLTANQSGSLRPSAVLKAVINGQRSYRITSIVRTRLQEVEVA